MGHALEVGTSEASVRAVCSLGRWRPAPGPLPAGPECLSSSPPPGAEASTGFCCGDTDVRTVAAASGGGSRVCENREVDVGDAPEAAHPRRVGAGGATAQTGQNAPWDVTAGSHVGIPCGGQATDSPGESRGPLHEPDRRTACRFQLDSTGRRPSVPQSPPSSELGEAVG